MRNVIILTINFVQGSSVKNSILCELLYKLSLSSLIDC